MGKCIQYPATHAHALIERDKTVALLLILIITLITVYVGVRSGNNNYDDPSFGLQKWNEVGICMGLLWMLG